MKTNLMKISYIIILCLILQIIVGCGTEISVSTNNEKFKEIILTIDETEDVTKQPKFDEFLSRMRSCSPTKFVVINQEYDNQYIIEFDKHFGKCNLKYYAKGRGEECVLTLDQMENIYTLSAMDSIVDNNDNCQEI